MNIKLFVKYLLLIVLFILSGCYSRSNRVNPSDSVFEPTRATNSDDMADLHQAYPIETPTFIAAYPFPNATSIIRVSPTLTASPSVTAAPTISPDFTPTTTIQSYTGKPFTIVFTRDGNLWSAEIGGKGERQITHEPEGWWVYRFDINQQGDKIAYISLKGQFPDVVNGMIKQFDLKTSAVNPVVGMEDQLLEDRLKWLDEDHLAYEYTEYPVKEIDTTAEPIPAGEYHPYNYFVVELKSGKKTFFADAVDISQSPDGRYLVTCLASYVFEPNCKFRLRDLPTNQEQPVAADSTFGWFEGWSSDSKWMLFANATYGNRETDRKYLIVDPVSRLDTWVLLPGASCESTAWAFHSSIVACNVCESEKSCQVRFWGPKGTQVKPPIALPRQFRAISWTPDDNRLVLASDDRSLWIVNIDGTGLRQILYNALDWSILP